MPVSIPHHELRCWATAIQLHRDEPLSRTPRRQRRIRARPRGRLVENGGRSHGIDRAYDFSDAVGFQTAYLAGYFADKYDVGADESIERANERVKKSAEEAFASTVERYDTVTAESSSVQLHGGKAKYALYPVWILNTTWKGQKYTFAMNGQTGKFVGDLPVDKAAARRWKLILTAAFLPPFTLRRGFSGFSIFFKEELK